LAELLTSLQWTIRPGRYLFLVWNRNWKRLPEPHNRFDPEADEIVVKLRWT
jgi:hypothetical protein